MTRRSSATFVLGLMALTGAWPRAGAGQDDPQALQRMVASERAFAAATAEIGTRDGFLAFFAADSLRIDPTVGGRDARVVPAVPGLAAQPLAPLPLGAVLVWNPFTGQIADDQSIGWLTGPFVALDKVTGEVAGQGAYFSVWKRQPDGTWRVWLDEGVSLPEIWRDATDFLAALPPGGGRGGTPDETIDQAETAIAAGGDAWRGRWSDSVRIHRQGRMPIVGRSAAVPWSREVWSGVTFHRVQVESSSTNDFAVVLGGYEAKVGAGTERGTWARVWRRDIQGRWRIVFETSKVVA
ncbi:MAG TPA: hypothetical protein VMM93_14930 [Vicinamibacterales bacterium]|nr:hypothetical protein [Vicinamibacterales bacterium]